MDAAATAAAIDNQFDNIFGLYLNREKNSIPSSFYSKNSKYTRLPDFDIERKVSWPQKYVGEPRLRRVVSIEEPIDRTSRSLKSIVAVVPKKTSSNASRKIVTIEENNENIDRDCSPKFYQNTGTSHTKTVNRCVEIKCKDAKQLTQRTTARLSSPSKISRESKSSAKSNTVNSKKFNDKNKHSALPNQIKDVKKRNTKKDNVLIIQSDYSPKISSRRKIISQSERTKEEYQINNKSNQCLKKNSLQGKNISHMNQTGKSSLKSPKGNSIMKNLKENKSPVSIIQVPKGRLKNIYEENKSQGKVLAKNKAYDLNRSTEIEKGVISKDVNVGTEPLYNSVDQETAIDEGFLTCNFHGDIQSYDRCNEVFDSLDIPSVSLTKDKNDLCKDEIANFFSQSLPNIRLPALNMISLKKTQNGQIKESLFCNNNSYIIGRATVTYTSKQKIDFQVVKNHENNLKSHLRSSPLNYPVSVVSMFKKELAKREYDNCTEYKKKQNKVHNNSEQRKNLTSLNCSLVFDSDKLKKPSDIISTIKVDNSLIQNSSLSEQFQRELNFIDSFFESLQYLETCSLSDKSFIENNVENWINSSYNFDCGSFLSKFENDICVDENETMASTSLCRLNLLIRHEQRRAKNLLFVLKMREDALKDFTKSQILWLENKKKQENTDIPTLKKKQRGALLKLQHECGEMQRIRKALLTRSEKRKIVLLKTKKNLEWKLENNLDVEKIILGKKKLNRAFSSDRSIAPLKCFDLSSSGCDESTTSRPRSNTSVILEHEAPSKVSVEKSIQAGDSKIELIDSGQSSDIAKEHFIVVDGGYLNIIFRDLALPQIFSGEKQYEVNEEAIKRILCSSSLQDPIVDKGGAIEKLVDDIKSHEFENISTPSTARSLLEEFDQYYKGTLDEDTHEALDRNYNELDYDTTNLIHKVEDILKIDLHNKSPVLIEDDVQDIHKLFPFQSCHNEIPSVSPETPIVADTQAAGYKDVTLKPDAEQRVSASVAGPLPVPPGAAAVYEPPVTQEKSASSLLDEGSNNVSSTIATSLSSLGSNEAEELRRQQLAIEREIKALEQQQCQFLVVREIPDKPPPPYTPPNETRPPKPSRPFSVDITTKERIKNYLLESDSSDTAGLTSDTDAFKLFVKDFCQDSLERQKAEHSDKVWHTCCILPPKPQPDVDKLVDKTATDLSEVLTCVNPTILSGVGARRSDHIDDILFAEWRRCEPEWTDLHADEVIVKNKLFENMFQMVISEAIEEYIKIVMGK